MPNSQAATAILQRRWYSTTDAARLLGVSVGTVQHMVEDGRLSGWKTSGGHRRIDGQSLASLLQQVSHQKPQLVVYAPQMQADTAAQVYANGRLAVQVPYWQLVVFTQAMPLLVHLSRLSQHRSQDVLVLDLRGKPREHDQSLLQQLATSAELRLTFCIVGVDEGTTIPAICEAWRCVRFAPMTDDLLLGYLSALPNQRR